jgi:hypothetical protein
VFTARYGLSPYITQTRLYCKGFNSDCVCWYLGTSYLWYDETAVCALLSVNVSITAVDNSKVFMLTGTFSWRLEIVK